MSKKRMYVIIAILIVAAVVAVLIRNRAVLRTAGGGITLSAYPVTVTTARKEPLSNVLTYIGTITANNDVDIVAETSGRVTAVRAMVGDVKRVGDVLIEVDDELAAADCVAAEVGYEKARRDLERSETLLADSSIPESQCEAIRLSCRAAEAQYITARRALRNTRITTPITGTVTACAVDTGAMVQKDNVVANVVDIATLRVKLSVPEGDVFKLAVGDTAEVASDVYPRVIFRGVIRTIGSRADDAHTYPLEVGLPNCGETPLKANMFGRVTFNAQSHREALVLPRQALVGSVENPQVFVVRGKVARLHDITMGEVNGLNVEILNGLTAADTVVIDGQYNLRDSVEVAVVGLENKR